MSSIATALKAEIQRIARKEIRSQIEITRKATIQHRHEIALLKRQIRQLAQANRNGPAAAPASAAPAEPAAGRQTRFSAKGLRALRARLDLSAQQMADLLGVASQSIYNWEQQKSVPRKQLRDAIVALRALTRRSARDRLEALEASR